MRLLVIECIGFLLPVTTVTYAFSALPTADVRGWCASGVIPAGKETIVLKLIEQSSFLERESTQI